MSKHLELKKITTPIPNGPTLVTFKLLERSDDAGWEVLDEFKSDDVKEEFNIEEFDDVGDRDNTVLQYAIDVVNEYYA